MVWAEIGFENALKGSCGFGGTAFFLLLGAIFSLKRKPVLYEK